MVLKILLGVEEKLSASFFAAEKLFGQGRLFVGDVRLLAYQGNRSARLAFAKLLGHLAAGEAAADDQVLGGLPADS